MIGLTSLQSAIDKGHTYAVTFDPIKGEQKLISTHKSFAEACRALRANSGNTVYAIDDLLACLTLIGLTGASLFRDFPII